MTLISEAEHAASSAAQRAGVQVRSLEDPSDLFIAGRLFDEVWPQGPGATHVQSNLMRALVHSGGYVSAAFIDDVPVGAALAVVGRHRVAGGSESDPQTWHTHLHSHMAGVIEQYRDRKIGTALKLHQRWWALFHGIDTIVWSFDPLVRRNAWLNLHKLGTEVRDYITDFYGVMNDAINAGGATDRVFAWWILESARARQAAVHALPAVDTERFEPGTYRLVATPEDVVSLRASSAEDANSWRMTLREEFLSAIAVGLYVAGLDSGGNYVFCDPSAIFIQEQS